MNGVGGVTCSRNDDLTLALYFRKQLDDCDQALDVAEADLHICICSQPSMMPILTMGAGEDAAGCVLTLDPTETGKASLLIPSHFWLLHDSEDFSVHAVVAIGGRVEQLGSQFLSLRGAVA